MSEFENRIDAQRAILIEVNKLKSLKEKLTGLSKQSIERWIMTNQDVIPQQIKTLVIRSSEKLFFLANHSEDQISEEYIYLKSELEDIRGKIIVLIKNLSLTNAVADSAVIS